jgi:geranylgeranyl pyrophosphate synthase
VLRSLATASEWGFVESLIHEESISQEAMLKVLELVDQYDTAGKTLEAASKWTDRALSALSRFPNSAARTDLETLARRLLMRFS